MPKFSNTQAEQEIMRGAEPTWTRPFLDPDDAREAISNAFNWYNDRADAEDLKQYALDYFTSLNGTGPDQTTLRAVSHLHERNFRTLGALCRMLSRGCHMPEDVKVSFERHLVKLYTEAAKPRVKKIPQIDPVVSRIVTAIESDLDTFLTSGKGLDLDLLTLFTDTSATQRKKVCNHFKHTRADLVAWVAGDPEMREAYPYKRRVLLKLQLHLDNVCRYAERKKAVKRVSKRTRKKRK